MSRKQTRAVESGSVLCVQQILIGAAAGLVLAALEVFLIAILVNQEAIPLNACKILSAVMIFIACSVAALLASLHREKKLFHAVFAAALVVLLLFSMGAAFFSGALDTGRLLVSFAAAVAGALGGTVLSGLMR